MNTNNFLEIFDDVYDVWEPVWWQKPVNWFIGGGIGIVIFALMGLAFYIKRRRNLPLQRRLDFLLQQLVKVVPTQENQKDIYRIIIDIVQETITIQYYIPAVHLTDQELIQFLSNHTSNDGLLPLKAVIDRAAASRFAGIIYPGERIKEDIEITSVLIKKFLEPKIAA